MDGDSIKERRVSPQNAESRSPNFQRQKSFMTKEVNQKCHGPMTSGNSPPPRSPPRYVFTLLFLRVSLSLCAYGSKNEFGPQGYT